ncbi:MAG TPA: glycoside hydrolase family 3 N-terminal domain-containing protein, partial [Solirubrobacteraceae bacterium]
MAERVQRVVGTRPRRRVGLGALMAALVVVGALVVAGVFTAAPSAKTDRTTQRSSQFGLTPRQQSASNFVNGLLRRMTVAEKFGQLEMAGPSTPTGSDLIPLAKAGQIGSVLDLTGVDNINAVQKAALQSRLHIPLIFSLDVIHGYKTMYPISLGESSSWDPALARTDASMAAAEGAADGIKWTFSPMVDVTRDPRWGRVQGTSGEDPFLGSALAAARIHGYQGPDFGAADRMAATIKHFAAYGAPVAGREYNTVDMSTQQLFNDYLPTYKAGVKAGVATVMSAFNSLNGVPATADQYTLQTILR